MSQHDETRDADHLADRDAGRDASLTADVVRFPSHPTVNDDALLDDERPLLRDVLGDVLRDERLEQERTLADVAEEAAVSLPYLSEIERGRKEVSSDVLDAVIRSLGIELDEVLERAADRVARPTHVEPGVRGLRAVDGGRQWRGPQARLLAA